MTERRSCWCGQSDLAPFSDEYARCPSCGTLVSQVGLSLEQLEVSNDDEDFYGKQYWLQHQDRDLGFPDIYARARNDLTDRNLHWLRTLLKYRLPPARTLELGCSHGSFVGMLHQVGYDAQGVEMSPWVVEFGKQAFGVPISVGPVENLPFAQRSFDVIALMDVLEHLPDPVGTMRTCISLLNPDGLLLIQTPQFRPEMTYDELIATNAPFLEQFKADEHLYLYTQESVRRLFAGLGAPHICFEPAIFGHYDMFFVVSCGEIKESAKEDIAPALLDKPTGRFVLAMLDLVDKLSGLQEQITIIDGDRAARLTQIHTLTDIIHAFRRENSEGANANRPKT